MFGLDQIGGVWQDIGEWIIIFILVCCTAWFWSMVTRTALGIVGLGPNRETQRDNTNYCDHNLNRNMITGIYTCSKCNEEFD